MSELQKRKADPTAILARMNDQIARALPRHLETERFARVALTAIRNDRNLQACFDTAQGQASILGAIMQAATLGLEPGVLGQGWLVPYRRKGVQECQWITGYRGMIDLARRSGAIKTIYAHTVYQKDEFEFSFGMGGTLKHRPSLEADRGQLLGVYAFAELEGGAFQYDFLPLSEVQKIKASSAAGNYGPWKDHFEEMAKKTAIRRLFKYLPISVDPEPGTVYIDAGTGQTVATVNASTPAESLTQRFLEASTPSDKTSGQDSADDAERATINRSIGQLLRQCRIEGEELEAVHATLEAVDLEELTAIRDKLKAADATQHEEKMSAREEIAIGLSEGVLP